MAEVWDWSRTAGQNNDAAPNGFPEGMPPGDVNDAAREVMAVVARYFQTVAGTVGSSGTGQEYRVLFDANFSWSTGRPVSFIAHTASLANPRLQVNSLPAVEIRDSRGRALTAGAFTSNTLVDGRYDGQHFRMREATDLRAYVNAQVLIEQNARIADVNAEETARQTADTGLQQAIDAIPVYIPAGSKMLFYQASAPAGWTKDTSQNDRVLRVVDGNGGGNGGSWTISGLTVDDHTLTLAEMPRHGHSITGRRRAFDSVGAEPIEIAVLHQYSGTSAAYNSSTQISEVGGGPLPPTNTVQTHPHNHGLSADGTWRPAYIDVIICTKD